MFRVLKWVLLRCKGVGEILRLEKKSSQTLEDLRQFLYLMCLQSLEKKKKKRKRFLTVVFIEFSLQTEV